MSVSALAGHSDDADVIYLRQRVVNVMQSECRVRLTKGTLLRLFKKSGSDNPLLFHYLTPLPRVNRRAGPRLVSINHGYRYLGDVDRELEAQEERFTTLEKG